MTYISSRNGTSRLNTFLVASSLSSSRRLASRGVDIFVSLRCGWGPGLVAGPGSVHVLRAVDLDRGARDVAGPVREQEGDGGRDLGRLADAAQRDARRHGRLAVLGQL